MVFCLIEKSFTICIYQNSHQMMRVNVDNFLFILFQQTMNINVWFDFEKSFVRWFLDFLEC